MGKRKKKLYKQEATDMTPYTPCPIPEAYKPTPFMDDIEWRKVARLLIRLKRLTDIN
ncbi:hypothetical protein OMDBNIEC_00038 [Salmonella phage STP-SP5]|nr:hypothetical protein OMDBNIEC_00038 [Salmonella phage STP-SP5]